MNNSDGKQRLVIVGNGMVGHRLVEMLVDRGSLDRFHVTVIGEEPRPAYDRVTMSEYFAGADAEDLCLVPAGFYEEHAICFRRGERVASIDRERHSIRTVSGDEVVYDQLVLATGSAPFVPPIPGVDADGVFVYRTIEDLGAIRRRAEATRETGRAAGVVIGGGLLGLEAANALHNLGLQTHVVEMAPGLMPRQLDERGGAALRRRIEMLGIAVHTGVRTDCIVADGSGAVSGVRIRRPGDGDAMEAEMLDASLTIISAGIRPRDELARDAGLALGERGGIAVDDLMATDDPCISAVGEVASHHGVVYGLVAPGYDMARALADRLCEADDPHHFVGGDLSAKLKLLGVDVASFGDNLGETAGSRSIVLDDEATDGYKRLTVCADTGRVLGGMLVGDTSSYDTLRLMVAGDLPTPETPSSLLAAPGDALMTDPSGLPDTAMVCTCETVDAGCVRAAVRAGCGGVDAVRSETRAGTGCAGCVPMLTDVVNAELEARGVDVDRSLCEHFAFTRQELFDLVRFHRHTSWAAILDAHGSGRGCHVCKPTVASILASLANGYILDGDQGSLQDTNDHVLANMQRNGTYSVVPRVPGGEITPDQLIVLGQVAKDYGLYTKITGGQRIDLFGAVLDDLPAIWQRCIDAGLESGHAYGKALRTVKSCVGETWCRYGVQDSVAMAIRLETRYRGLRSPHKLKSAVSGCTRECAEAQSKDFGVIATERGWNLYVCGNGGKTPRHADLFATDLDDETLIRYIDRFLMFYIRTADRLERTSVWFSKLEGGLDHLRSVVIDDSLGIAAELEADMAAHVESYECEWAATLADDARRSRFVSYVNAPDARDPDLVFVEERGQLRPATDAERARFEMIDDVDPAEVAVTFA